MFPSPKAGEMLDPASFRAMHDRILEAIGAEHVRFHDMRHTFATLALKNGVDVRTLSEMLGHYSAGFTLSRHSLAGMALGPVSLPVAARAVRRIILTLEGSAGAGFVFDRFKITYMPWTNYLTPLKCC